MLKKYIILFSYFFFFFSQKTNAEALLEIGNWGANVGISATFGTKTNRIGLKINTYYFYEYAQINVQWASFYAFNHFGTNQKRKEHQASVGIVGAVGDFAEAEKNSVENSFLHPVSNQTSHSHSLGYAYKWYFDDIGTSQNGGMIGFQIKHFHAVVENDIFAGTGSDRYRTGAFLVAYQKEDIQIALSNILWTGNPKIKGSKRIRNSDYPSPFGYFEYKDLPHSAHSHGILSLQVSYRLPHAQIASGNIGIDAEQVRHFIQNRLIHDMPFVPKKWNKAKNPHVPMLTDKGKLYLYGENQRVRKARFWATASLNPTLFY